MPQQFGSLRFALKGELLVAGSFEGQLHRFDATTEAFTPLAPLRGHQGWIQALAFSPDGTRLASGDSWGRLCLWQQPKSATTPTHTLAQAHAGWIQQLAVRGTGDLLASVGADRQVRLWDFANGKSVRQWTLPVDLYAGTFAPQGQTLWVGDLRGQVRALEVSSGQIVRTLDASELYRLDRIQEVGGVRCLSFTPDGKRLLVAGCKPTSGVFVQGSPMVLAFEPDTGKKWAEWKLGNDNDGYVFDIAWHPAGFAVLVTSGQPGQGKVHFLHLEEKQPFFSAAIPNCHAVALHPNGSGFMVCATNANSSGNGRPVPKDQQYPANTSPLHWWEK